MALFTTTPAREMIPIMVIMMTKSILKIRSPSNTPMNERITVVKIKKGMRAELNWPTMIKKIKKTAIKRAPDKKPSSLACSSCWPVKSRATPLGNS